jgi:hypothetical protein
VKLAQALTTIAALGTGMMASMKVYSNMKAKDFAGVVSASAAMMGLAFALLVMSAAVANLGRMNPTQLTQGMAAVLMLMTGLVLATKELQKAVSGKGKEGVGKQMLLAAASLIIFAYAVGQLAKTVVILGNLEPDVLFNRAYSFYEIF